MEKCVESSHPLFRPTAELPVGSILGLLSSSNLVRVGINPQLILVFDNKKHECLI
jgi:hypothetical protein